jgi:hypothetical protein
VSISALFVKLREALEAAGVPYLVTGSFASSAHGVPRSTNDIDVVIAPTRAELAALLEHFAGDAYYADREDAFDALRHRSQFNVIEQASLWKVDFIFSEDIPFERARFARRVVAEFAGVMLYTATAEDVIIAKLRWAKLGESIRQIDDAAGIIRMQKDRLDLAYIERWVQSLDIETQWRTARERAANASSS